MKCYIISSRTLSIKAYYDVTSYKLYPSTVSNKTGTAVLDASTSDLSGNYIYLSGSLYIIGKCTPKDGQTTLILYDPINIFSRAIIYSSGASTVGAYIKKQIQDEFVNCTDDAFKLSYITVNSNDTMAYLEPVLSSGGLFDLSEYMLSARAEGLNIEISYKPGGITVDISDRVPQHHAVLFNDGNNTLTSATFSNDITAKVTVRKGSDDDGWTSYTYYLSSTGEISADIPEERKMGAWVYTTCPSDDDPEQAAKDVFDKNDASHKIVFHSFKQFAMYDTVTLRIDDKLISSVITDIEVSSADDGYVYTCGQLATTLTDKIAAQEKSKIRRQN